MKRLKKLGMRSTAVLTALLLCAGMARITAFAAYDENGVWQETVDKDGNKVYDRSGLIKNEDGTETWVAPSSDKWQQILHDWIAAGYHKDQNGWIINQANLRVDPETGAPIHGAYGNGSVVDDYTAANGKNDDLGDPAYASVSRDTNDHYYFSTITVSEDAIDPDFRPYTPDPEPTPEPKPTPTPEPDEPEPTPTPTPEPDEPEPTPTPEPDEPEPTPTPTPEPDEPEPTPTPTPEPDEPEPTPTPTPEPDEPEPTPTPGPVDPNPDPPPVEIDDPEVPLAEIPDEEPPLAMIPEDDPEDLIEIEDDEIPLADVPETGDNSYGWSALALLSGAGLAWLALYKKRKGSAE